MEFAHAPGGLGKCWDDCRGSLTGMGFGGEVGAVAYLTSPRATDRMPSGVPYIIGNEFAERFSFYGMRAVLFAFMTTALVTHDGAKDLMSEAKATARIKAIWLTQRSVNHMNEAKA